MAKFRVEAKFYCYIDEAGMQKHILKEADLETEPEDDQGELELDEAGADRIYTPDYVFASYTENVVNGYFKVESVDGESVKCVDAGSGAHYIYQKAELWDKHGTKQFRESTQLAWIGASAEGTGEAEATEAPVTADGTTVEEAVKKAMNDLVGHLDQPLALSGSENGIWSNKILDGDVEICKDEVHDLLNAEADGLRAVFVLTLKDKK